MMNTNEDERALRVYTGGTFDLFHPGHLAFLQRCKSFGSVVVSLNTDEFIEKYKGKPPVMNFSEREAVLLGCRYVDQVVANTGGADSRPAIELVQPDLIVIGSDWASKDYHAQMGFDQAWLDSRNIGLCYIPYTKGVSTTSLKDRLAKYLK
jgi:glycerol-3-phosphate cytidylyltransferase